MIEKMDDIKDTQDLMDADLFDLTPKERIRVRLAQWHCDEPMDLEKCYDYADRLVADLARWGLHIMPGVSLATPNWCEQHPFMQQELEGLWGKYLTLKVYPSARHQAWSKLSGKFWETPEVEALMGRYDEWLAGQ